LTFARIVKAVEKVNSDLTKLERYIAQQELDETVKLFVQTLEPEPRSTS
jgi:hypothetical protein